MTVKTEWMLDVLDDLISFCALNGIEGAAQKLDGTRRELAEELQREQAMRELRVTREVHPLS